MQIKNDNLQLFNINPVVSLRRIVNDGVDYCAYIELPEDRGESEHYIISRANRQNLPSW